MGVSPSPHHIFLMEWESRQLDSTVSRFLFRALKKLNLTGQNGGRFFPSNSIWHFMAIDFWMGLCAKKEADIWNWNGLSNEGNSQPKGRRTFFWVAHRYLLRDYVHCSIQGGFLAHQRTQVRQEVRSSVRWRIKRNHHSRLKAKTCPICWQNISFFPFLLSGGSGCWDVS